MPDKPYSKIKSFSPSVAHQPRRAGTPPYAELVVTSNFSFHRGASHPDELVRTAAELGYKAISIADHNTLSGIVRAHTAAKEHSIPFVVGSRIEIHSKSAKIPILLYPHSRKGYGNLCRILTTGKRRSVAGSCTIYPEDILNNHEDLDLVILPPLLKGADEDSYKKELSAIFNCWDRRFLSIALIPSFNNRTRARWEYTQRFATELSLPLLATNDVYFHHPSRKPLQDVMTCIREKCTIQRAGFKIAQNRERHLKPPEEIYRLFRDHPEALRRSLDIAERAASFSLNELRYEYPDEICPNGESPLQYLTELTLSGLSHRYPGGIPTKVRATIDEELALINELHYEKYFLTCYDIVKFARSKGILCQGRGAAANSAVCYALGITAVDPSKIQLLFARFVSKERNEPPDIDIDFEHERREEVIQYIYEKYGRERAGLTAEVITYRHRSALRDVGKALGLSLDVVDKLAKSSHRWRSHELRSEDLALMGLNPEDKTIKNTLMIAGELLGFPRHLSQHVGGFIICEKPLCETVPILNASMEKRTIIEWDKDDIDALGMLKIDLLALGMLTCIRKALILINNKLPATPITLATIPAEDPKVYDMISDADTVGVFQIESRAQMSMLPRLKPRCFYDLVIEVAIVRPGPIQGNMVHPYLKRRSGLEKPYYPDKRVEEVLGKTLGVPLFQEQAMRLAIVLAGFTPGEAEKLRRAMAAWKRNKGLIATFESKILKGMISNGYTLQFAQSCMNQLRGFSEYGFPESHAASFANLAYASAWIKRHHPAEFVTALLNSQPMGFYAPSQLIRDAEAHKVKVLPVDINRSRWDTAIENDSVRLGFHIIKGIRKDEVLLITSVLETGRIFRSIEEIWRILPTVSKATLIKLAKADAFSQIYSSSRDALWAIRSLPEEQTPMDRLWEGGPPPALRPLTVPQAMFQDYATTGFSLRSHPIATIRKILNERGAVTAASLRNPLRSSGKEYSVSVAGIGICRQRPPTAKGVVFITLEDETGIVNLIVKPDIFETFSRTIISTSCFLATGTLERVDKVIYILPNKIESLDSLVLNETRITS